MISKKQIYLIINIGLVFFVGGCLYSTGETALLMMKSNHQSPSTEQETEQQQKELEKSIENSFGSTSKAIAAVLSEIGFCIWIGGSLISWFIKEPQKEQQ